MTMRANLHRIKGITLVKIYTFDIH